MTERTVDEPHVAAIGNANILVGDEPRSWRSVVRLGFGAITYALIELADAVREHGDGRHG